VHGHPFSGPLELWWGKTGLLERPRNLFGSSVGEMLPASDRFRAPGEQTVTCGNGQVRRTALHRLMAKLTDRIHHAEQDPGDNTSIPSGYTYLLQFIAHDMVDSVVSFDINGADIIPGACNARSQALRLETLYGSGPDECPQAYEYTSEQMMQGLIPRIQLPLGRRTDGPLPEGNPYCPLRDIARSTSPNPTAGLDASDPLLTEAMLADPRNDAHAVNLEGTRITTGGVRDPQRGRRRQPNRPARVASPRVP